MKQKRKNSIIDFPDRWWFRYLIYGEVIYTLFSPHMHYLLVGVLIVFAFYLLRSPDMVIIEEGILTKILWFERVIDWDQIKKVRISPNKILITDGYTIALPIVAFRWRKNYQEVKKILKEKIPDKVHESVLYELL